MAIFSQSKSSLGCYTGSHYISDLNHQLGCVQLGAVWHQLQLEGDNITTALLVISRKIGEIK